MVNKQKKSYKPINKMIQSIEQRDEEGQLLIF